jgi:hypothetical protein
MRSMLGIMPQRIGAANLGIVFAGESVSLSFVSQSLHRLYRRGAAGRSQACCQSDDR